MVVKPEEIIKAQLEAETQALAAAAEIKAQHDMTIADRFRAAVNVRKRQIVEGDAPVENLSRSPLNQFRLIAAASVASLLSIGVLQLGQATGDYAHFDRTRAAQNQIKADTTIAATQIQSAAAIEQERVTNERRTADTYAQNQIADIDYLIVDDYLYDPNRPPDMSRFRQIDPNKRMMVVDRANRCIGGMAGGRFFFLGQNNAICSEGNFQ